jgi:O-acetyl-ADP-ribose deacetylase (regulator of RNase III)
MVEVVRGSVLDQDVEAIVNAANTTMRGGGGIDGVIHQAAGPRLLDELRRVARQGCPTGEVVVTAGFDTGFRFILHTPGPIWRGGKVGEPDLLASCYRNCLRRADELGVRSLAFPSISTGTYGYPLEAAARLALVTIRATMLQVSSVQRVVFAMYGAIEYATFREALAER